MRIVPLSGSHDRLSFDCGRPVLNDWIRSMARQHQDKGLSKTFVAVLDEQPKLICGYYAMTVTEVDTSSLPVARRKKLPRVAPGIRLGRWAVSLAFQGKRLGQLLLMNAIERSRIIQEHAGIVALFVDALDEQAANFYRRYGFEAFADEPLKLFLPVSGIASI